MAETVITLLGGFAAAVDGKTLPDNAWRLRKARELVKLLALAPGHRLHREQVMDALWRDRAPGSAANNLHQAVHAARRALGAEAIEVRDELIRLNADVDVDEFERAVADARRLGTPAAHRAALSLYGGELLPENRCELHVETPGPQCEVHLHQMGGEVAKVPEGATAFAERSIPFLINAVTGWHDPDAAGPHIDWARTTIAAAAHVATGRAYVNFLGDADAARSSYGAETYAKLVALKNEYDPTNVFRLNQNIEPTAA